MNSELIDPKSWTKVNNNIIIEAKEAFKMVIKLQKKSEIVIKPFDKGAGINILDFKEYILKHAQITLRLELNPDIDTILTQF